MRSIRALTEEELLRGSDVRRRRPQVADDRAAPPRIAARPPPEGVALEGEPIAGAPGWRVTRRAGAGAEVTAGPSLRPADSGAAEPPHAVPGEPATLVRSPRRAAAAGRRGRGISLVALAAAAVIVTFVLGLAALDAGSWGEHAATSPAAAAITHAARAVAALASNGS